MNFKLDNKESIKKTFEQIYEKLSINLFTESTSNGAAVEFYNEITETINGSLTEMVLKLEQLNEFCQKKIKANNSQGFSLELQILLSSCQNNQNNIARNLIMPQSVLGFLSLNVSQYSDEIRKDTVLS